MQFVKKKNS